MYEVAFDGWTRTPEEIKRCKHWRYRFKRHRIRIVKAYKYNRLDWDIIIAFITNRKIDFS